MSKCLITGYEGFIGSHMADYLVKKGIDVYASVYADTKNTKHLKGIISMVNCDIRDKDKLEKIMIDIKPDLVFHFAAQSLVIPSWQDIKETLDTNILGTFYVLDAIRKANIDPTVVVACSSAEYGLNYSHEIPVKETKEFRPISPYGVSKIGTDMFAYLYWQAYKMRVIRIRPFNMTGPGKVFDACSDFARGKIGRAHV